MPAIDVLLEATDALARHGAILQGQYRRRARQKPVASDLSDFLAAFAGNKNRHRVVRVLSTVVIDRRGGPLRQFWMTPGDGGQQVPNLHRRRVARSAPYVNIDNGIRRFNNRPARDLKNLCDSCDS